MLACLVQLVLRASHRFGGLSPVGTIQCGYVNQVEGAYTGRLLDAQIGVVSLACCKKGLILVIIPDAQIAK